MFYFNGYTVLFAIIAIAGIALLMAVATNNSALSRLKDGNARASSEFYWAAVSLLVMMFVRSFIKTSSGWFVLLLLTAVLSVAIWFVADALLRKQYGQGFSAPMLVGAGVMFGVGVLSWLVRGVIGAGVVLGVIVSAAAVAAVLFAPSLPRLKAGSR